MVQPLGSAGIEVIGRGGRNGLLGGRGSPESPSQRRDRGYISRSCWGCQSNSQNFGQTSKALKIWFCNLLNLLVVGKLTLINMDRNYEKKTFSMAHLCYTSHSITNELFKTLLTARLLTAPFFQGRERWQAGLLRMSFQVFCRVPQVYRRLSGAGGKY